MIDPLRYSYLASFHVPTPCHSERQRGILIRKQNRHIVNDDMPVLFVPVFFH